MIVLAVVINGRYLADDQITTFLFGIKFVVNIRKQSNRISVFNFHGPPGWNGYGESVQPEVDVRFRINFIPL